jgi:hypothetical protein
MKTLRIVHTLATQILTMMLVAVILAGNRYMNPEALLDGGWTIHPMFAGAAAVVLAIGPLLLALLGQHRVVD